MPVVRPFILLLLACALAGGVAAGAGPLAPVAAAKPFVVKHGDHGRAVKRLQRLLGVHADGAFGRSTVRALRRFQRRHSLTPDGKAGPATFRALRHAARRGRVRSGRRSRARGGVRVMSRGPSVRMLQRRLGITPDGVYGPATARAVRRFQRRRGMPRDGIVGPVTWRALGIRGRHPVLKPLHGGRRARRGRSGTPMAVTRAIRAANRIDSKPYRYGGGHGSFRDSGYDCSGSLSYVLHGAGLLHTPRDSSQFMHWGAPGRGRFITIYANPGHAYMVIFNRRFDTSGASPARWQSDMRSTAGYVARHPVGL